jgi:hypothetical protein
MKNLSVLTIPFLLLVSCVSHDLNHAVDCSLSDLSLSINSVTTATSCSTTDGSIYIEVSGGKQPYVYLLNSQEQPSGTFTNLHAGIYSVGVRDANGCDTVLTNIIVMAKDFSFASQLEPDDQCLSDNGSVVIEVSDGNPPYNYSIDGGGFSETNTFSGLSNGDHLIIVKDNQECTIALNVTVPRGNTGVSWTSDIKPIIEKSCAVSGCHNGITRTDLRLYSNAKKHAVEIKSLTRDRSMPFDGSIPQSQIDLISCWVDDGALEN